MSSFQTVRGMRDLLPDEAELLTYVVSKSKQTATTYGFKEVITPIVEPYELLSAKSGEEIRQRMFTFKDLGDRPVALRPEFTASIARLATNALRNEAKPLRVFSVGTVYRYDEPQRGRYREFWQANFELMGSNKPEADAEIILLADTFLKKLDLTDYAFKLGHVGVAKGIMSQENIDEKTQNSVLQLMDKKEYNKALSLIKSEKCQTALQGLIELKGKNAFETIEKMRSHVQGYQKASEAVENLNSILKLVTESGCEIRNLDPAFARGLEYYTGMIFELYIPELEIAIGGGGRYDKLIEAFGGEPTPAVGMATGIDRITLALQTQKTPLKIQRAKRVAVVPVKDEMKIEALKIAQMLRNQGIPVEFEVMGRKMGKALEDADKRKVDYAVIVGEKELKEEKVVLKNWASRTQTEVKIAELVDKIKN
jgi:histidyl-tRNA synthetase